MNFSEADTRAKLIDPKLKESLWDENFIVREYYFTDGRKLLGNQRTKRLFADYLLRYKNINLAIIEAKKLGKQPTEGLQQAINYAEKLKVKFIYATNGEKIYEHSLITGKCYFTDKFPTPEELYNKCIDNQNNLKENLLKEPFYLSGNFKPRYYQEIAVQSVMEAISEGKNRILLTLATGTGKTFIAFQIVNKVLKNNWNLDNSQRKPRILFLADRNILADQAINTFNPFERDLVEAYEYMKKQENISTAEWEKLQNDSLFGNEKTPLAYVMGVMNLILHGIESPNLYKQNSLTINIRDIQEKDRYDVILANPPFGGKEKSQIQQNFPVQSNATELLFLQHFMKSLKQGGKAGIIIPEGVLFQTNNAFKQVKQELLENFNVHTIVSLPSGVFLPYSGVKTNIIFFDRTGSTSDIWYYEVNPPYKLTKNKPILFDHFEEFLKLSDKKENSQNSWTMNVKDIKDFDISAKNPNKVEDIEHLPPLEIVEKIKTNDESITNLIDEIELILVNGY